MSTGECDGAECIWRWSNIYQIWLLIDDECQVDCVCSDPPIDNQGMAIVPCVPDTGTQSAPQAVADPSLPLPDAIDDRGRPRGAFAARRFLGMVMNDLSLTKDDAVGGQPGLYSTTVKIPPPDSWKYASVAVTSWGISNGAANVEASAFGFDAGLRLDGDEIEIVCRMTCRSGNPPDDLKGTVNVQLSLFS